MCSLTKLLCNVDRYYLSSLSHVKKMCNFTDCCCCRLVLTIAALVPNNQFKKMNGIVAPIMYSDRTNVNTNYSLLFSP